jgi:hypothetical protein
MRAPPEQQTITTGSFPFERALDRPRDFFTDHDAHAAADEAVLHRRDDRAEPFNLAFGNDDGVLEPGRFFAGQQTCSIWLGVGELQRVGRGQVFVVLGPFAVEQDAQPFDGVDFEVMSALRADVQRGDQVFVVDDLIAVGTFHPQAFRDAAGFFLGRRRDRLLGLFEPRHNVQLITAKSEV